jgi:outer membrane receptor for ferrienterochelin and colicins
LEQLVDGITGFTAQGRTATIGTPSLVPETSVSTDLGVYFENGAGWSTNVSVFNNDFRDKITAGVPVPNCTFAGAPDLPGCVNYGSFPTQETFGQSINVDEARTRGAEFAARVPVLGVASWSTNYTFTESEQLSGPNAGFALTNTPRHMVNSQLRATFTTRLDGWVSGEYRSARARRLSSNTNAAWEALGDFREYGLVHVGGSFAVLPNLTLRATIFNALNTDFLRFASYAVAPTSANPTGVAYTNLYNNHQEGRRLWVSTTITF